MAHFLKSLASTIVLNTRTEPCLCMQYFSFDNIFSWIIPFEELWKIKSDLSIKTLVHHEESLWQAPGDGRPTHTRRRPSFGQSDYWVHQRQRLRQNRLPSRHCASVEDCARFEGTLPVQLTEFEVLLEGYLAKAEQGAGVDTSAGEEIRTLAAEFFKDGVFVHDQMSFRDYLEDLEDMVDGDDSEEDQEEDDSDLEDEMEMFGKEVMKWFAVERSSVKTSQRTTGKSKKENARGRG
ncbi:unnamed protein product [Arctogadus glacialis]